MDKKKIIITIGVIITIIASIVTIVMIVNNKEPEEEFTIDGINLPSNKEILKEKTVDNIKITNISLLTRNGISTYKATALNETDEDIDIKQLDIIFYENGIEHKMIALYNTKIIANQEKKINITSEQDLSNVTKIEYILK